ncbi:hypothetical protein [Achromobacter phage ewik_TL4]|nr:hypothetical protein AMA1_54 [Achromobacter phage AMA1]WNO48574.1 hypothetical protein [Achromobacter phage hasilly_LB3]WNO48771.1 hypothetical protein [Achromobacter phage nyaak_TL1]WNO48836.1 hypothetical protein [Achromobacter phage maay_LB1]WNO48899.1 hypothetical protein [Achromobacter phage kuwaak_TL2]WNO48964.1 hypothetical protein [Achromobacter phage ewii_LB8]WNO49254.1 hypothetical protein [Achromobacter phage ewik_TL4]WNO49321.1 hypothetical protein [Achromobacter phage kwar_LB
MRTLCSMNMVRYKLELGAIFRDELRNIVVIVVIIVKR